MRRFTVSAVALPVVAVALASCVSLSSSATLRFGGTVFGGLNAYSLDDWNDVIDLSNGSATDKDDNITSGMSFGVGPHLLVNDQWMIGAHFEKLTPKKSSDDLDVELAANALGASVG
ncbi:MAG: hypothetical protein HOP12_03495 [Candidatus Eisenbacteria bacterium]|uniref:Outer membrane protein beta-barrel domain-containing protein n=1 Tax=Eiseniibacteriota bacterium TaxID=2212470 RepID=A0A849SMW6_UNCEI|nr:hypothetical protein [Candidatus Eisenbacteria bacterium]